jgi:hypothetical protein
MAIVAIALALAAFTTDARAVPVALGSLSSASGSVELKENLLLNLVAGTADTYSFTLADDAKISGNVSFKAISQLVGFSLAIDLTSGPLTVAHAVATDAHLSLLPPFALVPASPGLFSLDLKAGDYVLVLTGGLGRYNGTLTFSPATVTPVPATAALFSTALLSLGFLGWRRKVPDRRWKAARSRGGRATPSEIRRSSLLPFRNHAGESVGIRAWEKRQAAAA